MAALQKVLDDSVPSSELDRANKQYAELTMKYRDLLQKDNRLVQRTTTLEHLEVLLIPFIFPLVFILCNEIVMR